MEVDTVSRRKEADAMNAETHVHATGGPIVSPLG
jgi:hypothetical protein